MTTTTYAVDPVDSADRSNQAIAACGLPDEAQGLTELACADFTALLFRLMSTGQLLVILGDKTSPSAILAAFRAGITVTLDDAALVVAAAEKEGSL